MGRRRRQWPLGTLSHRSGDTAAPAAYRLPTLVGIVAAITILSFFGRWSWLLDLLSFGRQHLLLAALALAIMAWAARRKGWSAAAMAVAACNLIAMAPSAGSGIAPAAAAMPGTPLRVVALNVLNENTHSASVVSFLRSAKPM